jgi:hypothetical protein
MIGGCGAMPTKTMELLSAISGANEKVELPTVADVATRKPGGTSGRGRTVERQAAPTEIYFRGMCGF